MDKKSFVLYLDHQELFNKLPDEIAGKLIKHIFNYVNGDDKPIDDLLLDVAFAPIKQTLKRDAEKWLKQLEQRSAAGKKSAEKRASKANEQPTNSTTVESRSTNSTDSVSVSVSVSDSVIDNKSLVGQDAQLAEEITTRRNKGFEHFWRTWGECKKAIGTTNTAPKAESKKKFNLLFTQKQMQSKGEVWFRNEINSMCDLAVKAHQSILETQGTFESSPYKRFERMMPAKFFTQKQWRDEQSEVAA